MKKITKLNIPNELLTLYIFGEKLSLILDILKIAHPTNHPKSIQVRVHIIFPIILFNPKNSGKYTLFILYPPRVKINRNGAIPQTIILLAFLFIPIKLRKDCIIGKVIKINIAVPKVVNR